MHWDIIIIVKCKRNNVPTIIDRLVCHHSIWETIPEKERQIESKSESDKKEGAPQIDVHGDYQTINCKASAFHENDELGLKLYLGTIKDLEILHFLPTSTKEKRTKIFHITKYSAIIVFIVILAHESILIFARKEELDLNSWLISISFSIIGSLATLGIDSLMVWKEHHN